ncbi:MAG: GTP cyclohydrolase I FolE [Endomicrobium sp.]|nr:GTP cyclohydrolase I FolE [Endomicrobium sp.]
MKISNFDEKKAQKAVKLLLESFGENLNREGLKRTPERVVKFYKKILSGNVINPLKFTSTCYTIEDHNNGVILVKDIFFYSICEHHLLPFFGKAHIAYIPKNDKIIGISKFVELIEIFAHRLQLQEKLTKQIADTIVLSIQPQGVIVIIEAKHLCISMTKDVKNFGTKVITFVKRGIFCKDTKKCLEILLLLGMDPCVVRSEKSK